MTRIHQIAIDNYDIKYQINGDRPSIYGLGDDSEVYYWSVERGIWLLAKIERLDKVMDDAKKQQWDLENK